VNIWPEFPGGTHGERGREVWGLVPHLQPIRWSGKRRELPSGVRDRVPPGNALWRILKATERSFLYLYADALNNLVLEILKHDNI